MVEDLGERVEINVEERGYKEASGRDGDKKTRTASLEID